MYTVTLSFENIPSISMPPSGNGESIKATNVHRCPAGSNPDGLRV